MSDRHIPPPRPGLLVSEGPSFEVRYFHGHGLDGHSCDRRQPYSVWQDTGMAGLYRWQVRRFCATEEEAMAFVKERYVAASPVERLKGELAAVRERQATPQADSATGP